VSVVSVMLYVALYVVLVSVMNGATVVNVSYTCAISNVSDTLDIFATVQLLTKSRAWFINSSMHIFCISKYSSVHHYNLSMRSCLRIVSIRVNPRTCLHVIIAVVMAETIPGMRIS